MNFRELFPPGSHLYQVPDDFRGMSLSAWLSDAERKLANIRAQFEARVASGAMQREHEAHLADLRARHKTHFTERKIWNPRDSYGL